MPVGKKLEIVTLVNRSPVSKRETLLELGMARSTFYRWQRRYRAQGEVGLVDRRPEPGSVWNLLRPSEQESILTEALRQPEWSPRELAFHVSDHAGFAVSESTVYRILKRHGLIREVRLQGFPAGKEYRVKTTRSNQQWQSDASYFFVVGWGWYYLISVLDDFSRMILAWDLRLDMTAASISDVVEQAVAFTGMRHVPVGRQDQTAHRQRSGLHRQGAGGLPAHAVDPPHPLLAPSSADQRQAGTLSSDAEDPLERTGLHQPGRAEAGDGGVYPVLQP